MSPEGETQKVVFCGPSKGGGLNKPLEGRRQGKLEGERGSPMIGIGRGSTFM